MKSSSSRQLRVVSFAVVAGIVVPLVFALIVHAWGAQTLAWPGFRSLLVFVYPLATVPVTTSLYGTFAVTALLNGCYYGCLAVFTMYLRRRVASVFVLLTVVLLVVLVASPILHLAFENLGAIRMR
jgi:hypothetical protein